MIAEISVVPIGVGESLSEYIKEALRAIGERGVKHKLTAMGTIVEVEDFETLCEILEDMRKRLNAMGAKRIYYVVKVDWSEKRRSIESKERSVSEDL